jgi:predicted ATP-binding protein involved in virulence
MNGSGKTTVLQAIDFISQVLIGLIEPWMLARGWSVQDLNCRLRKESNITLAVIFRTSSAQELFWTASFNRSEMRCSSEMVFLDKKPLFHSKDQTYLVEDKPRQPIAFVYQGSILSKLKDSELPAPIRELREYLWNIRSLELLAPHLLRKAGRSEDWDIGAGGEKLSGYLHTVKGEAKENLLALLKMFYPNVVDFNVVNMRAGWKKLYVVEQFANRKLVTQATHLSDGLLRILAVLTQTHSERSLVLLDEIENGINPEIIEKLVDALVQSPQQVLVTTHSPMILNFLDDAVARQAVQFIYKSPEGETRVRPFFSVPGIDAKLASMGPGEAFVDTDMVALAETCVALDATEAAARAAKELEGMV